MKRVQASWKRVALSPKCQKTVAGLTPARAAMLATLVRS